MYIYIICTYTYIYTYTLIYTVDVNWKWFTSSSGHVKHSIFSFVFFLRGAKVLVLRDWDWLLCTIYGDKKIYSFWSQLLVQASASWGIIWKTAHFKMNWSRGGPLLSSWAWIAKSQFVLTFRFTTLVNPPGSYI